MSFRLHQLLILLCVAALLTSFSTHGQNFGQGLIDKARGKKSRHSEGVDEAVKDAGDYLTGKKGEGKRVRAELRRFDENLSISQWDDKLDKNLAKVEREFCWIMCGKSKDCSCSVSVGVQADSNGKVTGWNPETGEVFEGQNDEIDMSKVEDVNKLMESFGIRPEEPAEFVKFPAVLGNLPPKDIDIKCPLQSCNARGLDKMYGSGAFLASRVDKKVVNGTTTLVRRAHAGLDLVANPGDVVRAPISGRYQPGQPYKNDSRLVGVKIISGDYEMRMYYVRPEEALRVGQAIKQGQVIGRVQNLHVKYRQEMTNHIHVELRDPSGKPVDPSPRLIKAVQPKSE